MTVNPPSRQIISILSAAFWKTAYALRIHRSTLQDRLSGIEKLMELDLSDPEQRLRLMISLKLLQYKEAESELLHERSRPKEHEGAEITFVGTDF